MADPFSVSAGVIGVVSLGLSACQGLISYYGPWKAYDDEIGDFTTKLEGLQSTLDVLGGFISEEHELDLPSNQYRRLVSTHLKSCEQACSRLDGMLTKCKSTDSLPLIRKHEWLRWQRALYPFKKETLVALSQAVSVMQDNLSLALQLLNGALIAQQQRQIQDLVSKTSSINLQTTKILNIVDKDTVSMVSSRAITHQPRRNNSGFQPILEPRTLKDLCCQQSLINAGWQKRRASATFPIELISRHCTCNKKSLSSSMYGFSAFAAHTANCPLYVEGQQTLGIAANYTFCNRLLGLSVNFMMTLTRGAGALSISPILQFHSVVANDFPAFKLLGDMKTEFNRERDHKVLERAQKALLQMLREKKAAPTDRLADGSTLLHKLAFQMFSSNSLSKDLLSINTLYGFVCALIEAGVPVGERTVDGHTPLEHFMWTLSSWTVAGNAFSAKDYLGIESSLLQQLLRSGCCLRSLDQRPIEPDMGQRWRDKMVYWATRSVGNIIINNGIEDIDISPIEMAIITRSEDALRQYLAQADHQWLSWDTPIPSFATLLMESLGWIPGMVLLLESSLPREADSVGNCFLRSCHLGKIESAVLLLKFRPTVSLRHVDAALECRDMEILEATMSLFASQRHELQELALNRLPAQALHSLGLPENGLLDAKAAPTYMALAQHGVVDWFALDLSRDWYSVYGLIADDIAWAELLYKSGFTNLGQCGDDGNPPLATLALHSEHSLSSLVNIAHWMICRGASLYQSSQEYLVIYDLARAFGILLSNVESIATHNNESPERTFVADMQSAHVDAAKLLSTLLSDDSRDNCLCACSVGGCSPLTRILREYSNYPWRRFPDLKPAIISRFQEAIYEISKTVGQRATVSATLRLFTFEALGMRHTCHSGYPGDPKPDPEETHEIRDEESSLLDQLDDLLVEFEQKYDELRVETALFFEGYWQIRMSEILEEKEMDPEDARQIREIGVVLSANVGNY